MRKFKFQVFTDLEPMPTILNSTAGLFSLTKLTIFTMFICKM